jgi:16S rRNA A1518/A1519 N6-dimethyltransferase RsmA/KsgA/DIM1 with predicted DNA glycosylase/AP lyase activity
MLRANNGMVPFIGTPHSVVKKIVDQFVLTQKSVFYDVGAGDGRVVFEVARRYPDAKVIGIELALFPYGIAKIRQWIGKTFFGNYHNVTFLRKDFRMHDFGEVTDMYVYLYPSVLDMVLVQVDKQKKHPVQVISGSFQSTAFPLHKKVVVSEKKKALIKKLFVYHLE